MSQPKHYMSVISPGPLILIRTPYPLPRWKDVLKALTPVMRAHGYVRKDISEIEGVLPYPDEPWRPDDRAFASRLAQAFDGDASILPTMWLYDWKAGQFTLVRKARTED